MLHPDVRQMFLDVNLDPDEFEDALKISYDRFRQLITAPDIQTKIEVRSLKRIKGADRLSEWLDYGSEEIIDNPHIKKVERFQRDVNTFYNKPVFEYGQIMNPDTGYAETKAVGVERWEPTFTLPFSEKEATRLYNLIPANRKYTSEFKIQIEGIERYFTIPDFEIWRDSEFDLLWEWCTTKQKPQEIKEKEVKLREKRRIEIKKLKDAANTSTNSIAATQQ
jgi:hypothetical protein